MNKFIVTENLHGIEIDKTNPVLYWVYFGDKYYLHKSKDFQQGYQKFLDDVFRGIRGKNYPEMYVNVVKHCKNLPSLYKVLISVEMNDTPGELLKHEAKLFKSMKADPLTLNNMDIGQFKPDWMLRHALADKCDKCPKTGSIDGKKAMFKFCPVCGRAIKKVHPSTIKQAKQVVKVIP